MATTNLISKSLGDILTESGNGSPDHTSPLGSLYTDKDSALLYLNNSGTTWVALNTVAYGEAYTQNNGTTATTITTVNVWAASAIPLTEGAVIGFSGGTEYLTLLNGYDGKYEVKGDITIGYIGVANFEVGLSFNDDDPIAGTYGGAYIDATHTRQHIGFKTIVDMVGGDTLSIDMRNITDNGNVYLRHAQLFARKVG